MSTSSYACCPPHVRRVVKGMDVVHSIEKAKCSKDDKPHEEIKMLNFSFPESADF